MKNILPLLTIIIFSCSAAKRTAKQADDISDLRQKLEAEKQVILAEGIAKYVKENPCIFPEINLDSLCQENYIIDKTTDSKITYFDEIKKNYTPTTRKIRAVQKILVPYEDKRNIQLLQDSNYSLKTRLKECEAKSVGKKEAVSEVIPLLIKPNKWAINNWFWIALSLGFSSIIYLVFKLKK